MFFSLQFGTPLSAYSRNAPWHNHTLVLQMIRIPHTALHTLSCILFYPHNDLLLVFHISKSKKIFSSISLRKTVHYKNIFKLFTIFYILFTLAIILPGLVQFCIQWALPVRTSPPERFHTALHTWGKRIFLHNVHIHFRKSFGTFRVALLHNSL